jgi:hypothetical protein
MLELTCEQRLTLDLEIFQAMQISGGATQSLFPRVEALLFSSSEYQQALRHVSSKKKMSGYRSVMDFLFCEIFTEYQRACRQFYDDKGPSLQEILSYEQCLIFEDALLRGLMVAHQARLRKLRMAWAGFSAKTRKIQKALLLQAA